MILLKKRTDLAAFAWTITSSGERRSSFHARISFTEVYTYNNFCSCYSSRSPTNDTYFEWPSVTFDWVLELQRIHCAKGFGVWEGAWPRFTFLSSRQTRHDEGPSTECPTPKGALLGHTAAVPLHYIIISRNTAVVLLLRGRLRGCPARNDHASVPSFTETGAGRSGLKPCDSFRWAPCP